MKSEFEERSFEQPLNRELLGNSPGIFAPGLMLEYFVGFDAAIVALSKQFWRLWPAGRPPGVSVAGVVPTQARKTLAGVTGFTANLFVQHKRSEYLFRSNAKERSSWGHAYYRYDVDTEQQTRLQTLAKAVHRDALVCYAAPAFHRIDVLWQHVLAATVMEHTNFCEARKLAGHARYSFDSPGTHGVAHSEPRPLRGRPFQAELRRLQGGPIRSEAKEQPRDRSPKIIEGLARSIRRQVRQWPLAKRVTESAKALVSRAAGGGEPGRLSAVLSDFTEVAVVSELLGLEWFVLGR